MKLPAFRTRTEPRRPRSGRPGEFLPIRGVHRNLLLADDGVWAWYVMHPMRWAMTSLGDRSALLNAVTQRWTDLVGHRVHIRGTAQPTPYEQWARELDAGGMAPDVEGTFTAEDFLVASQLAIAESGTDQPVSHLGVRISTRRLSHDALPLLLADRTSEVADIAEVRTTLRAVSGAVRRDGFGARPMSARSLAWLVHSSAALGIQPSMNSLIGDRHDWHEQDLGTFTEPVRVESPHPYAGRLHVTALRDGTRHQRDVAVLTTNRMGSRDTDLVDMWPWMSYTRALPFPVEWSACFDVVDGKELRDSATRTRGIADNQREHYEDHGMRPPPEVGVVLDDALRVEQEVHGHVRSLRTRLIGHVHLAVTASDEDTLAKRTGDVISAFAEDQAIELVQPAGGQRAMARSFVPGVAYDGLRGHLRQMPGYYAATAVPNATATLGDGQGPLIGFVGGYGRTACRFDAVWGPSNGVSGFGVIAAPQGEGKSFLAGGLAYNTFKTGGRVVMNDPTGSVLPVIELPDVRRFARHIDLSGAHAGILNPYTLVPDPRRSDFGTDEAHCSAVAEARAERRDLTVDALSGLLPGSNPVQHAVIEVGVSQVEDCFGQNPWAAVEAIARVNDVGAAVASQLRAAAGLKGGVLIFPAADHVPDLDLAAERFTLVTMRGIDPPTGEPRSRAERIALVVLYLSSRLTQRAMYADKDPIFISTDEVGIIGVGEHNALRRFGVRGARDSRRYNASLLSLAQNPTDLTGLTEQATNLISWGGIGRMRSLDAATAGLAMLGVPLDHGYEHTVMSLQRGEFLFKDYAGVVDKLGVNFDHLPHLTQALDTNPGVARRSGARLLVDVFDDEPALAVR